VTVGPYDMASRDRGPFPSLTHPDPHHPAMLAMDQPGDGGPIADLGPGIDGCPENHFVEEMTTRGVEGVHPVLVAHLEFDALVTESKGDLGDWWRAGGDERVQ
jgi:hypothetical protein